jgi:hypothetical protein
MVVATLLAWAVAAFVRQQALTDEQDRQRNVELSAGYSREHAVDWERARQDHRDTLAAIERDFYFHFTVAWLITMGGALLWAGRAANRGAAALPPAVRAAVPQPPATLGAETGETFLKCRCPSCGVAIEFPANAAGEKALCPKCGQETVLLPPA